MCVESSVCAKGKYRWYNVLVYRSFCIIRLCCICSTNEVLLGLRQFLVDVYQDLVVVWPGLLM